MNLSKNIKNVAKKRGLTMKAISAKMNIHAHSLSKTINNKGVRLSTLQAIADAIGCNISEFFTQEQEQQHKTKQDNKTRLICPYCGKHRNITITVEQDTTQDKTK